MFVIGLTGGIGSGKSTVANLFKEKNITVIDTDQLARDVTQKNSPALQTMVEHFGSDILAGDGSLNRSILREKIFKNPQERIYLENLLHPLIREEMKKQVTNAQSPYCILVIPLLFETKHNPLINRILVVDAPEAIQIERTKMRDKVSEESILAILNTQVTRNMRLAGADDVIMNYGKIEDLAPQVDKLHHSYLAIAKTFKA